MSVPEPLRHKGRLEVHIKAQTLAVHTLTVLGNEKIFDPSVDTELVHRIKSCALDIDAKLWSANKIRAGALSREKCDQSYQCWRAHAAHGNSHNLIRRMDAYYNSLWRDAQC